MNGDVGVAYRKVDWIGCGQNEDQKYGKWVNLLLRVYRKQREVAARQSFVLNF